MNIKRGAGIVLRDDRGRILLQHRDKNAPWEPNYWSFFGGIIEKGETPEEAVIRETKEELGIDLKGLKFFKKYVIAREDGLFEAFIFVAPLIMSIEILKKQQKEGQGLGLFSSDGVKKLKIPNYYRVVLKDLFANR